MRILDRRALTIAAAGVLAVPAVLTGCGGGSGSTSSAGSVASAPSTTTGGGAPSELRDYPYCEVIPDTTSGDTVTEHVFNTLPYGPCPPRRFTGVTEDDIVEAYNTAYGANATSATVNGPRHWVLDSIRSTGGVTSSPDKLTVDGIPFGLVATLQTPVGQPTVGSDPYTVTTVQRNTVYLFRMGRKVYELTDPSGNVYVMQSYSQQIDPSLKLRTLDGIGPTNQLPSGWSYRARTLDEDLTLTADGETKIVNDYYRNTYQINPAAG